MRELMKVSISGDPRYVSVIKMALNTALSLEDFCVDAIEDIGMAVAEACKIVTCHERSHWRKTYEVACFLGDHKVEIEITGAEKNGKIKKEEVPCLECLSEGDLGMEIIKSLMDEVYWKKGETGYEQVKLVKNR